MAKDSSTQVYQVNNAGIVLLAPFFPRLLSMLNLEENGVFKDEKTRFKAISVMSYSVYGSVDIPLSELTLFKVLVGLDVSTAVPSVIELSDNEKETVDIMLSAVINHWTSIGNTSVEGLRESFLQREGKLEDKEDHYQLSVNEKAYDMLLDSIPWDFKMIRFPWMAEAMIVNWR